MPLTLVGVDGLQVHDVADDVVLVRDAVAAQHVAGVAGDVQRLAARVALDQRDHLRRGPAAHTGNLHAHAKAWPCRTHRQSSRSRSS